MNRILATFIFLLICSGLNAGQNAPADKETLYWQLLPGGGIVWNLQQEKRLPHEDNMEMSGQNVAAIIHYQVDEQRRISIRREVIFPQLRTFIPSDAPKWQQYRAYLRCEYDDRLLPVIVAGERTFQPGPAERIEINGLLRIVHQEQQGLCLTRTLLPSMTSRLFAEIWHLENRSQHPVELQIGKLDLHREQAGQLGNYHMVVSCDAPGRVSLESGKSLEFPICYSAAKNGESIPKMTVPELMSERSDFICNISENLRLDCPDPVLNQLFTFSKIRAAESIYQTSMGLVHSPGGGRYYTGVWANDQAEYSGPFFPYLGVPVGNEAALNAYRVFAGHIPEKGGHFWSSFEMDGSLTCCGEDRGDAAMIAFGASQYCLAAGKASIAMELWPLIEWSLDYCESQKNESGVIRSDTDEMEGRIATGTANLATSCLYYGALRQALTLGTALNIPNQQLEEYRNRATALADAIENHFGADIDGLHTYRYFQGHPFLRHWICLPLVMDMDNRKEGTLEALFDRLWTDNGIRVELNPDLKDPDLFWDRGTLYAFRGAFRAGAADRGLARLRSYSTTRLLGFHVPYVVEAWPEGNMAHLSAESALYCRIITEGILGIDAAGFDSFYLTPRLPTEWNFLELSHMKSFGGDWTIRLDRMGNAYRLKVRNDTAIICDVRIREGEKVKIGKGKTD